MRPWTEPLELLVSVAHARSWLVTAALPKVYSIPALAILVAAASLAALALWAIVDRSRRSSHGAEENAS